MKIIRWFLVCCLLGVTHTFPSEPLPPGVAEARPSDPRAVAVDGKFLVPYQATVPGSEVTFSMVPIPGGTFLLGSPADEADRNDDEGPQVSVRVEPFWIGQYEVTWAEYKQFMALYDLFKDVERRKRRPVTDDDQLDAVTAPTPLYDPTYTFALGEEPRQPAVSMTEYAARQYTKFLSLATGEFYRLPTEGEWEYACRGGTTTAFSFGEDAENIDDYAWYFDNSDETYQTVGQKQPNAWGLYDMHGNVAEMVMDQYESDAYEEASRPENMPVPAADLLRWPNRLFDRVIRGGSWNDDPELLRCAARAVTEDWRTEDPNFPKSPWWFTDEQALTVGFRIVRPYRPPDLATQRKYWDYDVAAFLVEVQNRIAEGRGVSGLIDPP